MICWYDIHPTVSTPTLLPGRVWPQCIPEFFKYFSNSGIFVVGSTPKFVPRGQSESRRLYKFGHVHDESVVVPQFSGWLHALRRYSEPSSWRYYHWLVHNLFAPCLLYTF